MRSETISLAPGTCGAFGSGSAAFGAVALNIASAAVLGSLGRDIRLLVQCGRRSPQVSGARRQFNQQLRFPRCLLSVLVGPAGIGGTVSVRPCSTQGHPDCPRSEVASIEREKRAETVAHLETDGADRSRCLLAWAVPPAGPGLMLTSTSRYRHSESRCVSLSTRCCGCLQDRISRHVWRVRFGIRRSRCRSNSMRDHTVEASQVRAAHHRKGQTLGSALERDARQRNAPPITLASMIPETAVVIPVNLNTIGR
jgi:hypothetical protein